MKAVIAGLITIGVLWTIDALLYDGKYAVAVIRVLRPLVAQIGIHI